MELMVSAPDRFFLIVEPNGLRALWQIAKEKLRCGRFPTSKTEFAMRQSRIVLIACWPWPLCSDPSSGLVAAQSQGIFVPLLRLQDGSVRASGIPIANGFVDYFNLVNERDAGINGVKPSSGRSARPSTTPSRAVECYERLKSKNPVLVNRTARASPTSSSPRPPWTRCRLFHGYGMAATADGRWFPWVFSFPRPLEQASAVIRYIGEQEGGLAEAQGQEDRPHLSQQPYGKEANPTLEDLAKKYNFELTLLAVDHPGQEQKATWLQVRRLNPDWIYLSGWGVMNQVAVKEAAATGFRMDHLSATGGTTATPTWSPPGDAPRRTRARPFTLRGTNFKVFQDIVKFVYDKGKGAGKKEDMGRRSTIAASPTPCFPSRPSAPRWESTATRCSRPSRCGGGSSIST